MTTFTIEIHLAEGATLADARETRDYIRGQVQVAAVEQTGLDRYVRYIEFKSVGIVANNG